MNRKLVGFFLLLLGIILAGVMGCATAPTPKPVEPVVVEVPPATQQDLGELRDLLLQGKSEIQATCNAGRVLTQQTQGVPQASIDELDSSINRLENVRFQTWQVNQKVQATAKEYFADWGQKLQTMSGPVAEEGQKRRAASIASFEILQVKGKELADIYNPFVAKLLETARYLDTDRTVQGLKVVTPQINEQVALEPDLMKRIDALVGQIDTMKGGR